MIAKSIHGDGTATQKRRFLPLNDVHPLLRWSIVTYLPKAFDIQITETIEDGGRLLMQQRLDAVVHSNNYPAEAIRGSKTPAAVRHEEATIVRLISGAGTRAP